MIGAFLCAHCGRPMLTSVCIGGRSYHLECTKPPGWAPPQYEPMPPNRDGCKPAVLLTEADVRRIVREELAATAQAGAMPDAQGGADHA